MNNLISTAIVLALITQASAAFAADAKPCKEGQVLNPTTGKCVTKRGS